MKNELALPNFLFNLPIYDRSYMGHGWVSYESQMGHIWITYGSHMGNIFVQQFSVSSSDLHICDLVTIRPHFRYWKMNVIFDQLEESNPVVSLATYLWCVASYFFTHRLILPHEVDIFQFSCFVFFLFFFKVLTTGLLPLSFSIISSVFKKLQSKIRSLTKISPKIRNYSDLKL